MPASARSKRPRIEAEMQFSLLMELYDKGSECDTKSTVEAIQKFLAVSQPGVEKQIRWGWFFKSDRASWIVGTLRQGLNQFRDGNPFLRFSPATAVGVLAFDTAVEKFEDGVIWDQSHGRAVRVGSRDPGHLFITRVFELLTEIAPWLRVCERKDCRRFFLFQRPKQIYCSEQCAQRVRMARFLAQQTPGRRK